MANLHRGQDCRHLLRYGHSPADCRCRKAIDRYGTPAYSFLESPTWISAPVAAEVLEVPFSEVVRRAKEGAWPMRYPETVSTRVRVQGKDGPKEVTLREAVDRLRISMAELHQRIESGEIEAYYKDEHMEVQLSTRWEYEKCPLWEFAGICMDFGFRQ